MDNLDGSRLIEEVKDGGERDAWATLGLRALGSLLGAALLCCAVSASAQAAGTRLDPTFAGDGRAFTPLGTAGEEASVELASAPDGSTLVANALEGTVVRFLADGSRDTGFGTGGELVGGYEAAAEGLERFFHSRAVALDSRGRVLVFGAQADLRSFNPGGFSGSVSASEAVVFRFSSDGQPDSSFGEGKSFIRSDFGLGSGLRTSLPMVSVLTGGVDSRDRPVFVAGVSTETQAAMRMEAFQTARAQWYG